MKTQHFLFDGFILVSLGLCTLVYVFFQPPLCDYGYGATSFLIGVMIGRKYKKFSFWERTGIVWLGFAFKAFFVYYPKYDFWCFCAEWLLYGFLFTGLPVLFQKKSA